MKKLLFGLGLAIASVGCYYPSRFYIQSPQYGFDFTETVVINSQTGRQYVCTNSERFNTCLTRICTQTYPYLDMNNCGWQVNSFGYYVIYPVVPQQTYMPGVNIQNHHHHHGCEHQHKSIRQRMKRGN